MADDVDDLVGDLLSAMNARSTSTDGYMHGDHAEHTWGVPIPAIAFQWSIGGSNVLPLQRYFGISGVKKSFKSTLQFEIGNWFIANGGYHAYLDTEGKLSNSMMNAMKWAHPSEAVRSPSRCPVKPCKSVSEWQDMVTTNVSKLKALGARPPGSRIPVFVTIDSILGKSTDKAAEDLEKEGHAAERGYPIANLQITNYLEALSLLNTTASISWVQHMKESMEQTGYGKSYKEKGPQASQFATSTHIRVTKAATVMQYEKYPTAPFPDLPVEGHVLFLKTQLSCLGPDGRTIEVPLLWQWVPQDDGPDKQVMFFDWDYALGHLLWAMKYDAKFKPKVYSAQRERLDEALKFSASGKNINCEELELKKAKFTEFGKAIAENPEVKERVSTFLNIQQYNSVQEADIDFGDGK